MTNFQRTEEPRYTEQEWRTRTRSATARDNIVRSIRGSRLLKEHAEEVRRVLDQATQPDPVCDHTYEPYYEEHVLLGGVYAGWRCTLCQSFKPD